MANWKTDLAPSSFLKKENLDQQKGNLVTVARIAKENVAQNDQPEELKPVVYFKEFDNPLVLNVTNMQALEDATGTPDYERWPGARVVVYVDPNVSYAGKRVGGIRIRAVRQQATAPASVVSQPSAPEPVEDQGQYDDIPF